MQFPFTPTTGLQHKWGGQIQTVYGISHRQDKPKDGYSRDYWYFDCDVLWHDTGNVARHEVEPFKLCATEGSANPEIRALSEAMNDYLMEHGEWRESKPQGWYAHRAKKAA